MCYNISAETNPYALEELLEAKYEDYSDWDPFHAISGFAHPRLPVLTSEDPAKIRRMTWGLIPHWAENHAKAAELKNQTLNAKSETIFEKPSFRYPILRRRCLVPVTGFYEWQSVNGKKFPYFIYSKNKKPFVLAGIYDNWVDTDTGEILQGFSILTTEANPMMARIHNSKQRMPLILPHEKQKAWISANAGRLELESLMQVFDETEMDSHTVSKLVTQHANVPEAKDPFDYPELGLMLF
ncbi:MAG: protein of unknown function DUF159 [Bacteroidetes bacterium]|nr:MAG: protein of unknown function DUF159 [Bacteroidota bacterium]